MKEILISMLGKALRRERGSKDAKAGGFGTANIMSSLGTCRGIITVFLVSIVVWFAIILLVSCGSGKSLSKEKVNEKLVSTTNIDSVGESTKTAKTSSIAETADSSNRIKEEEKEGSEYKEVVTITETTLFDNDTTPNGKQKVMKTIKQTKIERYGSSSNAKSKESSFNKNGSLSITKEEKKESEKGSKQYANKENRNRNVESDKQQSISESKQIYYIALVLFGIVVVILIGILAYWVFSKYRERCR